MSLDDGANSRPSGDSLTVITDAGSRARNKRDFLIGDIAINVSFTRFFIVFPFAISP